MYVLKKTKLFQSRSHCDFYAHLTVKGMSIPEHYCIGLRDLLVNETNASVLLQLARSIVKNVCTIETPEDAISYLTSYIDDIHKVLYKRIITKDILFKYLHTRAPGTSTNFTKNDLAMRVIQYWDHKFKASSVQSTAAESYIEKEFPIHVIARKFSEWFFEKFNAINLNSSDFWNDSVLELKINANDGIHIIECNGAVDVLDSLVETKQQFGFYFNPNMSHSGCQGRIDIYGQVLVLCCGTLHISDTCVGVFESAFGLLRDPHQDNNWKPKKFNFLFRSEPSPPLLHTLSSSETLQAALTLPAPNDTQD